MSAPAEGLGRRSVEICGQRYEQLRRHVLEDQELGTQRWGLNLLLTRGLAAWIQACQSEPVERSEPPAMTPPTSTAVVAVRLLEPVQQQMAAVLAEMILRRSL